MTYVDFTKYHQAEESPLESKDHHLRLLIESAKDYAVYTMDAEGCIGYWSTGAQALFGYTESEIIGQSAALLYTPEDRKGKELERVLRESNESGRAEDERWHVRKDGTRFFSSGVLTLLCDDRVEEGVKRGYAMIARDHTERRRAEEQLRESEEKYRSLFNSIDEGFCVIEMIFDAEGKPLDYRFLEVSPSFEKQTGITDAKGKRMREIAPQHEEHWFNIYGKIALTGEPARFENRAEQLHRWYDVYAFRVDQPESRKVAILFKDITGRKRAEDALRISQAELQESNDELERRVMERTAVLSETNAVLQQEVRERQRIEGERVELLRRVIFAQEDERRRIAREMHDQFGQGLSALTLKLATLKEVSGEQVKLREQLEILESVAKQLDADVDFLVWQLRPTVLDDLGLPTALQAYVANWSKHFSVPAELHVIGLKQERLTSEIETVLYRITQEALNNTAKHARAGKVDVILEHRNRHVSLIIEDDGVGFDGTQVFKPNDKGLGLIGVRERATLVGGTAEIESQPDKGTTVFIRIPAQPMPRYGDEQHE